jgi:hypothetical protein
MIRYPVILLLLTSWVFTALASPSQWVKITDNKSRHCSQENPCSLAHEKSQEAFQIIFDLKAEENKLYLEKVHIANSQQMKQSFSDLDNFQALFKNEQYNLFAFDLDRDGYLDLALEASISNKMGPMYFYWVYDSKNKTFVQTPEQIEELKHNSKGQLVGAASLQRYTINKQNQLLPSKE